MKTALLCFCATLSLAGLACSSSSTEEDTDAQESNATASPCTSIDSPFACTPAPGSPLRKQISNHLRGLVREDLTRYGRAPSDAEIVFVYDTLLVQRGVFIAAARIVGADQVTPFDFRGTQYERQAGFQNSVKAVVNLRESFEFFHDIGEGNDFRRSACSFVELPTIPSGLYPAATNGSLPSNDCR